MQTDGLKHIKWLSSHRQAYGFSPQIYNKEILSEFENPFEAIEQLYDLLSEKQKEYLKITNCPPWSNDKVHIALVCYEKPGEFCHRDLVAKWINSYFNMEIVKEY